jgi:adenylate cyclase
MPVRITMQLIDASDDAHLWSEIYDRELDDIFAIQAEIAKKVVSAIVSGEAGDIPITRETVSPRAYDFYLRGRQLLHNWDGSNVRQSIAQFERAIEVDPEYARAWAGIANSAAALYMWWEASKENLQLADNASQRALELGPDISEAHTGRGFTLTLLKDFDAAVDEFELALELDPLSFDAWYFYGRARFAQGEIAESARLLEEAANVRPDDTVSMALAGNSYLALKDKENEVRCCEEALRRAEKHLLLNPGDTRVLGLGASCLQEIGDFERGKRWAERALAISPDDVSVLHNVGCLFAAEGDVERALDIFERRFALGDVYMEWIDNDADFDSIRDHPRFKALIDRQRSQ